MAGNIKLVVCDDGAAVAPKAATIFADLIRSNPAAVIGLATGSTPEQTYADLARIHQSENLSFAQVTSFNLDEYWGLDGDHEQSYRYFMNDRLFNHIDIRPWNTHVLNGKAVNSQLECRAFEDKILSVGGVDLWILGIGGNGHIAFNEPGSSVDSPTRLVHLTQETIDANSDGRFFSDPPKYRAAPYLLALAPFAKRARLYCWPPELRRPRRSLRLSTVLSIPIVRPASYRITRIAPSSSTGKPRPNCKILKEKTWNAMRSKSVSTKLLPRCSK